jgi:fructokinase
MDIRPENLTKQQLEKIIDFSNAVGALCATKRGGMPAMPSMQEVEACMKNVPKLDVI